MGLRTSKVKVLEENDDMLVAPNNSMPFLLVCEQPQLATTRAKDCVWVLIGLIGDALNHPAVKLHQRRRVMPATSRSSNEVQGHRVLQFPASRHT